MFDAPRVAPPVSTTQQQSDANLTGLFDIRPHMPLFDEAIVGPGVKLFTREPGMPVR